MQIITDLVERWLWPVGSPDTNTPAWRIAGRYAYALLRDLFEGQLTLRAMSLVYTTMLAIVPLLAFAFSVLTGLGLHRQLEPFLQNFLAPLGQRGDEIVQRVIGFVDNVSGGALASVSILFLLFSALSMAQKVESSFNYVWHVSRPRSFARRLSEYLSVMFAGPLLMSLAIGITATLASATAVARLREIEPLGTWLASLSSTVPYVMLTAGFSFLYLFVPNTRVRWRPAIVGGVFAGASWAAGGAIFAHFIVSASRTEVIYSGFAIVLIAMIWLQLSWLILLAGAQLAYYVQNPADLRFGQRVAESSNALRERLALAVMLSVGRDFQAPASVRDVERLAADLRVSRHTLEPVITALTASGLLTRTSEERLMPARDPRRIGLRTILDAVRSRNVADIDEERNETIHSISQAVETAIARALGDRTLADLVEEDSSGEAPPDDSAS